MGSKANGANSSKRKAVRAFKASSAVRSRIQRIAAELLAALRQAGYGAQLGKERRKVH